MTEETARLHAIVYGLVQGVNFRYHTCRQARQLGLTGWVRNLPDGSVEVLAEGPQQGLAQLRCYLQIGPPAARVAKVDEEWLAAEGGLVSFEIRW